MKTTNLRHLSTILLLPLFLCSIGGVLAGCSDNPVRPEESSGIRGVVTDEEGNTYPGVVVTLRKAGHEAALRRETTNFMGSFKFETISAGSYVVAIYPPRESELVGADPVEVEVVEGTISRADIAIRILPVEGIVVGAEGYSRRHNIRNASGDEPANPAEPLYHANDPEQLHPITAPDGHNVTLGEWRGARATARVSCGGSDGTHYLLTMEGLIPNGVYSVGVVLTDLTKDSPVRIGTGALGRIDGSENAFTASSSGEGRLEATAPPGPMSLNGRAPECALTQVSEAILWLFYHVDGQRGPGSEMSWVEHLRISF